MAFGGDAFTEISLWKIRGMFSQRKKAGNSEAAQEVTFITEYSVPRRLLQAVLFNYIFPYWSIN